MAAEAAEPAEVDDRSDAYRHANAPWDPRASMLQAQMTPPWWTKDPTENVKDLGEAIKATVAAEVKRQDDLRNKDAAHIRELMSLRAEYDEKLRAAEADRINAIQMRSDLTVQRAAEVQQAQANTLANQVATTADAFRASLAAALAPIMAAIEDLRRAQYEAQGQKTQVIEARDVRGESRLNLGVVISIAVLLVAVLSLVMLYVTKK